MINHRGTKGHRPAEPEIRNPKSETNSNRKKCPKWKNDGDRSHHQAESPIDSKRSWIKKTILERFESMGKLPYSLSVLKFRFSDLPRLAEFGGECI
jgi:hypothetical protein